MKAQRILSILIFLMLANNCMGKAKEKNPTEEALEYMQTLLPKNNELTKEKFKAIEGISFAGTSITDDKLKYVLILPNLSALSLTKTRITELGLESIKENKIVSLDIDGTLVTNKAIKVLLGWKHLRFLNISYTKINREAIPDLLKLNPQGLEVAGLNFPESDIKRLEHKISVRYEEYEIQCPGTVDSKCPEF
ncbi:hypothetical protein JWG45_21290 [Leptospira sp. 201903070]|uniref:Leucine-rich repeat domain-containing protein n=1 Tax=Leptospira ainlahdjerensis TaxID=2810033 RepID=A0ABS2UH37_9LEPT|nr:hypothetical protein [Leptospira ainlahdjerensis]MBM9579687.1 hypothetical protein [Leptospira ainlahdjerensis]